MWLAPLPVDPCLGDITARVREARAAVIVAAPGAGKTTRVPPALAGDGPVIVLQPRRVAARAIAARIAAEQEWTLGDEVGWHVRFERRFSAKTRVLLATEGILTARLLHDPLLSEFRTVVLDEFHERSLYADLGLALARQAWRARDDLRIVVMSATIDPRPVAEFLDACPVIQVPGREHPVAIDYAPGEPLVRAVEAMLPRSTGTILCFLPGAPEIRREMSAIARAMPDLELLPLHGSLMAEEQDAAIRASIPEGVSAAPTAPGASRASDASTVAAGRASGGLRRRVILATNIAETSLTVPGVSAVIDTGLHKVARYDAARGIDSLELERISQDSADQRAGRAGRLGPGLARRLWSERDRLRPQREPDITRVDLAATLLDLLAWGGDPDRFEWYETPPQPAIDAAWELLRRLGAVEAGTRLLEAVSVPTPTPTPPTTPTPTRTTTATTTTHTATPGAAPMRAPTLTPIGRTLQRLPLHPRLGRILLAADGSRDAARACALLSERHYIAPRHEATTCDLLAAIDCWSDVPPHVQRVARELETLSASAFNVHRSGGPAGSADAGGARGAEGLLRAILAGYPDRVARRRAPGSPRVLLASGHGAVISQESGVQDGEFLVALDVQAATTRQTGAGGQSSEVTEARIRIASLVERAWLQPTTRVVVHWVDPDTGRVKAARRDMYDSLVLAEHFVEPDPDAAARVLAEAYLARGLRDADQQLVRRLRFAGRALDVPALVERAALSARSLQAIDLSAHLTHDESRDLSRLAPTSIPVPSGRTARLDYQEDGSVHAAVKLQELFGLAETPRIGPQQTPVVLQLLAPNGRPVQTTRDLRSFWDRTYPDVRKELRGRYPKHPWPDDPWTATPTARAKPREPREKGSR